MSLHYLHKVGRGRHLTLTREKPQLINNAIQSEQSWPSLVKHERKIAKATGGEGKR
jgi:hypothetical protein